MENAVTGEVPIVLAGQDYTLQFDVPALLAVETKYSMPAIDLQADLPRIDILVAFLEAGTGGQAKMETLLREHKKNRACIIELTAEVRKALSYAYFGPTQDRVEETENETAPEAGE